MKPYLPLVARILMAIIFLMAGAHKVMDPGGTMGYMSAMGMPLTGLFFVLTIVVELGGGLSILLGYKMKYGALLLFAFLVPVTLIFHTNFGNQMDMLMFMKNMAIMGGLLALSEMDPGKISIESVLKARS